MDKLAKLLSHCKCSLLLTVNNHRDYYESAEQKLNSPEALDWDIPDGIRAKIIETDTLIELVFHPDTPIGFYHILHYDLDAALDEALEAVTQYPCRSSLPVLDDRTPEEICGYGDDGLCSH